MRYKPQVAWNRSRNGRVAFFFRLETYSQSWVEFGHRVSEPARVRVPHECANRCESFQNDLACLRRSLNDLNQFHSGEVRRLYR